MAIIHRVRCVSTGWLGGPGLNTFYFREGGGTVADAAVAQLGVDRVRAVFAALAGNHPNVHQFRVSPEVDAINDVTGTLVQSFGVTAPAVVNGAGGGSYGPIPAMFVLSLKTAGVVAGRRVAGRAFFGPNVIYNDTDGSPAAASLSAVTAAAGALLDKGISGPDVVVWSRPQEASVAPAPVRAARAGSSHIVTSFIVRDKFAVLRSRRD